MNNKLNDEGVNACLYIFSLYAHYYHIWNMMICIIKINTTTTASSFNHVFLLLMSH